jgi:hypothetical protein
MATPWGNNHAFETEWLHFMAVILIPCLPVSRVAYSKAGIVIRGYISFQESTMRTKLIQLY